MFKVEIWGGNGGGRHLITYPKSGCEGAFLFPKDGGSCSRRTRRQDWYSKQIRLVLEEAESVMGRLYFFMMKNRNALPRVWSSFSI